MTRAAFAIVFALLAGCDRPRPIEARPALWRLQDRDTTIWLLGSIHALPPGVRWRTPAIAQAEAAADTLILEIAPAEPQVAADAFVAAARGPGLASILDRVPRPERATLARGIDAADVSARTLDGLKTWGAALALTAAAGSRRGIDPANGVEAVIAPDFAGRAIGALETRAGQLATFDALPEADQRAMLIAAARGATKGDDPTFAAWRRGDEAALTATLASLAARPALERALVSGRNARWTTAIARRMRTPGRVLLVVGAGHLVGPRSVIAMLRARGWRVARVA